MAGRIFNFNDMLFFFFSDMIVALLNHYYAKNINIIFFAVNFTKQKRCDFLNGSLRFICIKF